MPLPPDTSQSYIPRNPTQGRPAPSGFNTALSAFQAQYGPQLQTLLNQYQSQSVTRPAELAAGYAGQSGALNQQYQAQLAGLGLQQQGTAIDQADVGRQMGYYDQLYGLDQQDAGRNIAYQNALKGYLGSSYQVTTGQHNDVLGQLRDAASQARFTAGRDTRTAASAATGAGAFTSQGHRQDNSDIQSVKQYTLSDIGHKTKQENLGYIQSTIDRDRNLAGIDNTIAGLGSDLARSGLNHSEQESRLQSRQQQLSLQAQQYGVTAQQYAATLQQGLSALNLNQIMSVGQLMDASSSTLGNVQQIIGQIIAAGYQYGSVGN